MCLGRMRCKRRACVGSGERRAVASRVAACATVRSVQASRRRRAHLVVLRACGGGTGAVTLIRCDHVTMSKSVFTAHFDNLGCYAKAI